MPLFLSSLKNLKVLSAIFLLVTIGASAQETTEKKKVVRPDIPGQFLIDWGVNGTTNAPAKFEKGWFGSRTLNFYYYYPLRIGKSKFSFDVGIGVGLDRFKLTNFYYLGDTAVNSKRFDLLPNYPDRALPADSTVFGRMKKSLLSMNYLDIPLEFKYSVNPDDPNHSFWFALGGRVGWLYSANTKIKYKLDGDKIVQKEKYKYGLNQFRYGPSLRVGVGNFNLFGFYNMSPLFQKDKGPSKTQMQSWTIGISIIGL